MKKLSPAPLWVAIPALALSVLAQAQNQGVTRVIHISVDGLRPDAITALGPSVLTNFYRLRKEGAFTHTARADFDYTITLPNHTCQLTGRRVVGPSGHGYTQNVDPPPGQTLASVHGSYVAGVFDVAHDHGLRTGLYASKTKFSLYKTSWDATNGAPDITGPDNGKNKLDTYVCIQNTTNLVTKFVTDTSAAPQDYTFLHLADPDSAGHSSGWDISPGSPYSQAVRQVDRCLGIIFQLLDSDPRFIGQVAIILTTDHGGTGYDHSDTTLPQDYTIPFYVWGPGVLAGADLYLLNQLNRRNPGTNCVTYSASPQPIRNGDCANLALKWLGLSLVPGSTINSAQDLAWTLDNQIDVRLTWDSSQPQLVFSTTTNVLYDIQANSTFGSSGWTTVTSNILGNGNPVTNLITAENVSRRFFRVAAHF
jgi:hypothetical protein